MSVVDGAEAALEGAVARTPLSRVLDPARSVRLLEWGVVGAIGMLIDLSITLALLGETHYLLANAAGFAVAVTSNFAGNWWLTYDRPDGRLGWQYASYVLLNGLSFGLRAATVVLFVEVLGTAAGIATGVGIAVASIANFAGTERLFGGAGEIWFDAVEGANHLAHAVWDSRLRRWLLATGLYGFVFAAYARALGLVYRSDERELAIGGVEATVATETPTEIVSVLHTIENERDVLEAFVDDVQPGDHVLDVGANLGVFGVLAGAAGASVTAVEPHPATAQRCRANLDRNGVDGEVIQAALGSEPGEVALSITNDAPGTQRPTVSDDGDVVVEQTVGDRLPTPDVVKIDVEGAERQVLKGLARTLRNEEPRILYVEVHDWETAQQITRKEMFWMGYSREIIQRGEQPMLRYQRVPDLVGQDGEIGSNDDTASDHHE